MREKLDEYRNQLETFHLPRYKELPDIELYMDQLIAYISKHLEILRVDGKENSLTTSMVNNYVKSGVLEPTTKKRYTRNHIAYLIVVCVFKQIYSISKISDMIKIQISVMDTEVAYDYFCTEFENALLSAFSMEGELSKDSSLYGMEERLYIRASVNAFAQKHLVEKYLDFSAEKIEKTKKSKSK